MDYIRDIRKQIGSRPIFMNGAVVLVLNERQEILLQHRADTGDWGVPGGAMELGESFAETAARELFEETGLICGELHLLSVLSGKDMYYRYPNGDEVYNVTAVFLAKGIAGEPHIHDGESLALRYFALDKPPKLHKIAEHILKTVQW